MTRGRAPLVVPEAPPAVAVRHRAASAEPPDVLAPYVQSVVRNGQIDDWLLTTDVVAFGEPGVTAAFDTWRAEWERAWTVDPILGLNRLLDAGDQYGIACPTLVGLLAEVQAASHEHMVVTVGADVVRSCSDEMGAVGDAVRRDGSHGFGFIDASGVRASVGLSRAWSPRGGREIVARDEHVALEMHPEDGLCVTLWHESGHQRLLQVDSVEHVAAGIRITGSEGVHGPTIVDLDPAHARPLGWLMPHASRWKVRRVPEVVVWARTFSAFEQAANVAHALGKPVRFGGQVPIAHMA